MKEEVKQIFLLYKSQALCHLGDGKNAQKLLEDIKSTSTQKVGYSTEINGLSYNREDKISLERCCLSNIANISLVFSEKMKSKSKRLNAALEAATKDSNGKDISASLHHASIYFYLLSGK